MCQLSELTATHGRRRALPSSPPQAPAVTLKYTSAAGGRLRSTRSHGRTEPGQRAGCARPAHTVGCSTAADGCALESRSRIPPTMRPYGRRMAQRSIGWFLVWCLLAACTQKEGSPGPDASAHDGAMYEATAVQIPPRCGRDPRAPRRELFRGPASKRRLRVCTPAPAREPAHLR
jgi:hypothetical protein